MNLSTRYLGLQLANPIVIGASPFCDNVAVARQLQDAGAAALVMHSLFEEQIEAEALKKETDAASVDRTDGLSCDFGDWRFNLRASNTENLLRLNVEAASSRALVEARAADLSTILNKWGAQ